VVIPAVDDEGGGAAELGLSLLPHAVAARATAATATAPRVRRERDTVVPFGRGLLRR
jgi:hypothetical protein